MTQRRLSFLLVLFFLALAIPSSVLVYQAYGQLKWEAFHQHQRLARELTLRIDAGFSELIRREENRPISDYAFLNITGSEGTGFLQRSPLSAFPAESDIPGLLGYFQVDGDGRLRTPLVPDEDAASFGISSNELRQRERQERVILGILDQNRLVVKTDLVASPEVEEESMDLGFSTLESDSLESVLSNKEILLERAMVADDRKAEVTSAFDELTARKAAPAETAVSSEQVKDLKLEDRYDVAASEGEAQPLQQQKKSEIKAKRTRKEQVNLPQAVTSEAYRLEKNNLGADGASAADEPVLNRQLIRIQTFESEVEPMEFALLDSGHFVLFRRVWQDRDVKIIS